MGIPTTLLAEMQKAFFQYLYFPYIEPNVSQQEMQKLRQDGGAKLINIKAKVDAYRIGWLLQLVTCPSLKTHKDVMEALLGKHKGNLKGTDLFFTTKHYAKKVFKIQYSF